MKPRICICCGEPILPEANAHSRNPNVCASCSSLLDGLEGFAVTTVEDSSNLPPIYDLEGVQLEFPEPEPGKSSTAEPRAKRVA